MLVTILANRKSRLNRLHFSDELLDRMIKTAEDLVARDPRILEYLREQCEEGSPAADWVEDYLEDSVE
jgi:hypothetical protein